MAICRAHWKLGEDASLHMLLHSSRHQQPAAFNLNSFKKLHHFSTVVRPRGSLVFCIHVHAYGSAYGSTLAAVLPAQPGTSWFSLPGAADASGNIVEVAWVARTWLKTGGWSFGGVR